jgi:hypothetical protein
MAGNVWEWSSDQLGSCASHACEANGVGTIDATNTDWYWNGGALPINFDGTIGPGGTSAGQVGPNYTTEWNFASQSFGATDFLAPLGLPLVGSVASSYDSQGIGTGTGQLNPNLFHGNHFWIYTDNGNSARGAFAGGDWGNGSESGRFSLYLYNGPTITYGSVGAGRCRAPAGL